MDFIEYPDEECSEMYDKINNEIKNTFLEYKNGFLISEECENNKMSLILIDTVKYIIYNIDKENIKKLIKCLYHNRISQKYHALWDAYRSDLFIYWKRYHENTHPMIHHNISKKENEWNYMLLCVTRMLTIIANINCL